jgi:hypothetical protein
VINRRIISAASASAVLTVVGLLGTGTALASTTAPAPVPGTDLGAPVQSALGQSAPLQSALGQSAPLQSALGQSAPVQSALGQSSRVQSALGQGLAAGTSDLTHPSDQVVVGPMKTAQGNQPQQAAGQLQTQAQASRSQAQQDVANDMAAQKATTSLLTCSVRISLAPTCAN